MTDFAIEDYLLCMGMHYRILSAARTNFSSAKMAWRAKT